MPSILFTEITVIIVRSFLKVKSFVILTILSFLIASRTFISIKISIIPIPFS